MVATFEGLRAVSRAMQNGFPFTRNVFSVLRNGAG
jgi:hypothetical protein